MESELKGCRQETLSAMRVYIETTVPSYLTSWPSPQVVHAGHQISTHDWWDNQRQNYELYTSLVTRQEAARGGEW